MPVIREINAVDLDNIQRINSISKSAIVGFDTVGTPSDTTDYVSTGLEFHVNASDTTSWTGTTTWTDLAGTENMSLINGPTKASGDDFVAFDGNNDRGEVAWGSSDYFYGSASTDKTMWTTMSMQVVISWPEDGSTGYIHSDAISTFGSRKQSSGMRGFFFQFGRRGMELNMFFGTKIIVEFPADTTEFQYNSSRGYYEPKPNRVYNMAICIDRSANPEVTCYLNGQTFTPDDVTGDATQVGTSSTINTTYLDDSSVRRGPSPWIANHFQFSNGSLTSSALTANWHECLLYSTKLSASEVQQNHDAYVDRYGALN